MQTAARENTSCSIIKQMDCASISVLMHLGENKSKLHNSIDIYQKGLDAGGENFCRKQLIS